MPLAKCIGQRVLEKPQVELTTSVHTLASLPYYNSVISGYLFLGICGLWLSESTTSSHCRRKSRRFPYLANSTIRHTGPAKDIGIMKSPIELSRCVTMTQGNDSDLRVCTMMP